MLITERKWQRWIDTTTQVCSHWRFVVPPTTIVFFASPSWLQNLFIYCLSLVVTDIYTKTRTRKWVCLCERLSYFVHYCFPHCYCLCHTLSGTICVSSRLILLVMSLLCLLRMFVCLFETIYIFFIGFVWFWISWIFVFWFQLYFVKSEQNVNQFLFLFLVIVTMIGATAILPTMP
jgi:hypothetical protein